MLDQNLTTLLSTLFGGLLAIIGGVATNYYLQSSSNKIGKQKEIRNIIEQIYKYTRDNYEFASNITYNKDEYITNTQGYKNYQSNIYSIEMLVNLYLSQLKQPFSLYNKDLKSYVYYIDFSGFEDPPPQPKNIDVDDITNTFREALTALLRKKGYSYF
jgi:hypothetical protein